MRRNQKGIILTDQITFHTKGTQKYRVKYSKVENVTNA